MTINRKPEEEYLAQACLLISDAMFKSVVHVVFVEINGERLRIQRTKTGIRYVDVQFGGETFRIMEQNRQKASRYAKMARERHQILWVFKRDQYYARYLDGQFMILKYNKGEKSGNLQIDS